MAIVATDLLKMTKPQLDELFRKSPAGPIPVGDTEGTAIVAPGTGVAGAIAGTVRALFWQGKVFDPVKGELRNKILPIGCQAIVAKVYKDPSWVDGKECIALDYSRTSMVAGWIRDEIRLVGEGVYLGVVFGGKTRLINFALKAQTIL